MQLSPRLALAALGLALAPAAASAQHIELITESKVTFAVVYTTSVTTTNGAAEAKDRVDSTRSYTSRVTNGDILEGLRVRGVLPDTSTSGWSFAAVRSAPADLVDVNTRFALYLLKTENGTVTQRVPVPASVFSSESSHPNFGFPHLVTNAVTTHSTRNIVTSNGSSIAYGEVSFTPNFVRTGVRPIVTGPFTEVVDGASRTYNLLESNEASFTVNSMFSTGFATIPFTTPKDNYPVFFFIVGPNFTLNVQGDFSGSLVNTQTFTRKYLTRGIPDFVESVNTDTEPTLDVGGLVTVKISVEAPKLVPRSDYGSAIPF